MTKKQKLAFQNRFFNAAGGNLLTVKEMMDGLPDAGFYIKDAEGRIVTFNKRNCEICNLPDEFSAIGLRSDELFPGDQSKTWLANDRTVLRSGRPLHTTHSHAADGSMRLSIKSVYPIRSADGRRLIGTMCLYRQNSTPEPALDWHDRIKGVTSYINAHPTEELTLKRLAELGSTTPSKLVRAFEKTLGTTPSRYVTTTRINLARRLLEETDDSITEIAQAAGFYDFSHFFHVFRRERGISPSQYRRQHRAI